MCRVCIEIGHAKNVSLRLAEFKLNRWTVSVFETQPLLLSIAPISVLVMLLALNRKKIWLVKLSLIGMVLSVIVIFAFQYLDYRHLESCMMQGGVYNPLQNACTKFH